ncbi:hypothetical protein [Frankia sp. Cj3]|uniref:hypothetical protein n=1 Tax=Frankia sp. Cj3 TaxID=2880976 RepID=UPI001EF5211B|nr:hypothetical protein [Frankia sp. Cj3]
MFEGVVVVVMEGTLDAECGGAGWGVEVGAEFGGGHGGGEGEVPADVFGVVDEGLVEGVGVVVALFDGAECVGVGVGGDGVGVEVAVGFDVGPGGAAVDEESSGADVEGGGVGVGGFVDGESEAKVAVGVFGAAADQAEPAVWGVVEVVGVVVGADDDEVAVGGRCGRRFRGRGRR